MRASAHIWCAPVSAFSLVVACGDHEVPGPVAVDRDACALLAVVLPPAGRAFAGPQGATVHIRWQPSVVESERRGLEARFRLADGERLDEHTWRYEVYRTIGDP